MPVFERFSWYGVEEVKIKAKTITKDVRGVFVSGQCHALALSVNAITGWPMYAAFSDDGTNIPDHVFVKCPKGYLDVNGINSLGIYTKYPYTIREVKKDEILAWVKHRNDGNSGGYLEPNLKDTQIYAEQVAKIGGHNVKSKAKVKRVPRLPLSRKDVASCTTR